MIIIKFSKLKYKIALVVLHRLDINHIYEYQSFDQLSKHSFRQKPKLGDLAISMSQMILPKTSGQ